MTATTAIARLDVYSRITSKMIADLEQGVRPWMKPWNADHAAGRITRPLRHNGIPIGHQRADAVVGGGGQRLHRPPVVTFKQAQELGGNVRKGVQAAWSSMPTASPDRGQRQRSGDRAGNPLPEGYTVFNVEQCEGLPAHFYASAEPLAPHPWSGSTRPTVFRRHRRRHPPRRYPRLLRPRPDYVQMPPFETFRDAESHAATLAHELTHWTKHERRLARDFGTQRNGDEGYAREELVAELGSAFLCADLGITPEVRDDHAAYITTG